VRWRGHARIAAAGAMISALLIFLLLWGPQLLRQRHTFEAARAGAGFQEHESNHLGATARRFAALPARMLFDTSDRIGLVSMGGVVLFVLPWLLMRREPALA